MNHFSLCVFILVLTWVCCSFLCAIYNWPFSRRLGHFWDSTTTQYTLEQLQKNPLVLKCRIHNFIFYLCFLKAEYTKTLAIVTIYCRLYSARTASQNLHAISNQSAKLNYNGGHAQNGRLCWTIILWLNIQSKNRTFSSRESNTITRKRLTLYLMSLNL